MKFKTFNLCFSPQVTVKTAKGASGHFMTRIYISMNVDFLDFYTSLFFLPTLKEELAALRIAVMMRMAGERSHCKEVVRKAKLLRGIYCCGGCSDEKAVTPGKTAWLNDEK